MVVAMNCGLTGLSFAALAHGRLDKPLIKPEIPSLGAGLVKKLKSTQSTHDQWGWGCTWQRKQNYWYLYRWTDWPGIGVPDRCHDVANAHNLSPYDIEVFNFHYTDCNDMTSGSCVATTRPKWVKSKWLMSLAVCPSECATGYEPRSGKL